MKLTDNQLPAAHTSGNMMTLNIGISNNAEDQLMILNVLTASVYTDKPAAVLREYGCNAFDANVEAGKGDIPIEVGLPNKLNPSLRIRDFGFGMTEEQIANTFVMLGRSTKRNSNAFTGMIGIGSKAGFAYGDSFMVTSYVDGQKVVYNAFRDKGVPKLARMLGPVETSEPDGIEIKVPVRMEDFEEFRQKAERIYRYFKVRPNITGALVTFLDSERLMSGNGWHYIGNGKSIAIMGNVGYALNSSGMGLQLGHAARVLLDLGVELEFNIGELKMTASREGLEYIDLTKAAVYNRLHTVIAEIGAAFTKQITNASCLWDARKIYGEIFERLGNSNVRQLKEVMDGRVLWKGAVINTGRMDLSHTDPEVNVYRAYKHHYSTRIQTEPGARSCYAGDHTQLVINDLPSKSQSPARQRGFFDRNPTKKEWVVFTFGNDAAQKRYWKYRSLEGAPTILLSSVTPAVSATQASNGPRTHNSKHSAKAFALDEAMSSVCTTRSLYWKQETVNLKTDSGSYVVLSEFYITKPQKLSGGLGSFDTEHPDVFRPKIAILRAAGLISGLVYGFKKTLIEGNKLGPGWVPLREAVDAKLNAAIVNQALNQTTADFVAASNHLPLIQLQHYKEFPVGTSVRDMLEKITKMRNPGAKALMNAVLNYEKVKPWIKKISLPPASVDLDKLKAAVLQDYPLLGHITGLDSMGDTRIPLVAEYVKRAK